MMDRLRGWPRRRKLAVATAGVVMLAGAGVAIAALLLQAPFSGGGNVLPEDETVAVSAVSVLQHPDIADCTATLGPDNGATLQLTDAHRGGFCIVGFTIARTGESPPPALKVQGVDFSDSTTESFESPSVCGQTVDDGSVVWVRFTVPASAPAGSFVANGTAGLKFVSSADWTAGNCPT